MSTDDDTEAVLASVVPLGNTPTARELELAEAVRRHVSNRHLPDDDKEPE